jgi:hypothetical protein
MFASGQFSNFGAPASRRMERDMRVSQSRNWIAAAALMWVWAGPAGAAITVLDTLPTTPQLHFNGTSQSIGFTIGAGTGSRLLLVSVNPGYSGNHADTAVSVSYGGQALTHAVTSPTNERRFAWLGYLTEADIAARSGDTLQVTLSGDTSNLSGTNVYIFSYDGVDQATPLTASGSVFIDSSMPVSLASDLSVEAGAYGVFAVHADLSGNPSDTGSDAYVFSNGVEPVSHFAASNDRATVEPGLAPEDP